MTPYTTSGAQRPGDETPAADVPDAQATALNPKVEAPTVRTTEAVRPLILLGAT
jgi:hypothetical protein